MAFGDDEKDRIVDFREVGSTGLRRYSGFVEDEFLQELISWKGAAIYKEMSTNDPVITSILLAINLLCRKVPWRTQPASRHPNDEDAAEFLTTCMNDMSMTWTDVIVEALTMLIHGFAAHEIVYKRRTGASLDPTMRSKYSDGRIGWRKLSMRSQDTIFRWHFDDKGGIQGLEQLAPPYFMNVTIPIEKMLLFRTTTNKNNPEGRSILRGAYTAWYKKKNIENIEGIGIERDLAGLPVAMVPPEILSSNASPAQKQILANIKSIVVNIRRDEQEGIVFPQAYDTSGKPMYELKLLSTGGTRQFDTDKVVNRYDRRIAMSMLADFLMLGHESVGSFALATSKTEMFATAIGSFLDSIADVFNRYAVPRLFDLNDFAISEYPEIKHGDLDAIDLKEMGDYLTKLAQTGMPLFPNPELERYLLKVAHLPEPPEPMTDEELQVEGTEKPPQSVKEIRGQEAQPEDYRSPADGQPIQNPVTNYSFGSGMPIGPQGTA